MAALVVTSGAAAAVHALVSPQATFRPAAQAPSGTAAQAPSGTAAQPPSGTAAQPPSGTASPSSRPVSLETIAAGSLDPARFPRRTITQALLLAGSVSVGGGGDPTVVAVDAADGEWVSAVVPGMPQLERPAASRRTVAP